ncbi:hypothetical protein JCM19235_5187 [Vibrio maritimus]|uniref:Uncharacterized protein n=1 Tax=Vibrio maritimus TaxID=990268 RepID=A0A090RQ04_9VIBR|nr:hypothetical protein JCM19235_5187 [Vibrio maritimus]
MSIFELVDVTSSDFQHGLWDSDVYLVNEVVSPIPPKVVMPKFVGV